MRESSAANALDSIAVKLESSSSPIDFLWAVVHGKLLVGTPKAWIGFLIVVYIRREYIEMDSRVQRDVTK